MSPTYIIPKQGNWFNVIDNMTEGLKVDTWCAYRIKNTRSITHSFYDNLTDGSGNIMTKAMVSTVDVQLVGLNAEYGVQSMAHWGMRSDIGIFLGASGMALLPAGLGEYVVSDFRQEGANTVLAFNASFDMAWLNEIATSQQILTQINLPSGYIQVVVSGIVTISQ